MISIADGSRRNTAAHNRILYIGVMLFVLLASVLLRLAFLDIPLGASPHAFRQTQTAITIQEWLFSGFSPLNYQTPVLGPPWTAMMEFPLYQTTVYLFVRLFHFSNLDMACRIVSIFYFYLSALALYALVKLYFDKRQIAAILFFYLFNPFCVCWSSAALVDFCSVAFALGYAALLIFWLRAVDLGIIRFLAAMVCGIFGYLSKSTTMIPTVIFLAGMIFYEIYMQSGCSRKNIAAAVEFLRTHKLKILLLVLLCMIPGAAGLAWMKYTDLTKEAVYQVRFLTSDSLREWNFGTLSQKLDAGNWAVVLLRIAFYVFPGISLAFPLMALLKISDRKFRFPIVFSFASVLLTVFILFNLYFVHSYYLIALADFLCIPAGVGALEALDRVRGRFGKKIAVWFCIAFSVVLAVSIWISNPIHDFIRAFENRDFIGSSEGESPALALKECTTREDFVVITDQDWSPVTLYSAQRKGFMARENASSILDPENLKMLKSYPFTTLFTEDSESVEAVSDHWKYLYLQKQIVWDGTAFFIYKFYDDEADFRTLVSSPDETLNPVDNGNGSWTVKAASDSAKTMCIHISQPVQAGTVTISAVGNEIPGGGKISGGSENPGSDEISDEVPSENTAANTLVFFVFPGRQSYYVNVEGISDSGSYAISSDADIQIESVDLYTGG